MHSARLEASRGPRLTSLITLTLLLSACGTSSEPSDCCVGATDTLATGLVDGRPVMVPLGAWENNGLVIIGGMGGTVSMIAFRPGASGGEGMQFWLDGFHGVGAYPVTGDGSPSSSTTVYWTGPVESGKAYWGDSVTGDTVWVSAFDTLTRGIEGRFSMRGSNGEIQVKLTEGHYVGVVHDYVPSP